jgi:hypothetical protein
MKGLALVIAVLVTSSCGPRPVRNEFNEDLWPINCTDLAPSIVSQLCARVQEKAGTTRFRLVKSVEWSSSHSNEIQVRTTSRADGATGQSYHFRKQTNTWEMVGVGFWIQ